MKIIQFISRISDLKNLERTGWKKMGLEGVESIADHNFSTALLIALFSDYIKEKRMDPLKMLMMAIVKDLGALFVGDTIWDVTASPEHDLGDLESEREKQAVENLVRPLEDEFPVAKTIIELAHNYLEQDDEYATLLKEIVKLETCFQALDYKKKNPELNFAGFFDTSDKYIQDPKFRDIFIRLKNTYYSI